MFRQRCANIVQIVRTYANSAPGEAYPWSARVIFE